MKVKRLEVEQLVLTQPVVVPEIVPDACVVYAGAPTTPGDAAELAVKSSNPLAVTGSVRAALAEHIFETSNPHATTLAQAVEASPVETCTGLDADMVDGKHASEMGVSLEDVVAGIVANVTGVEVLKPVFRTIPSTDSTTKYWPLECGADTAGHATVTPAEMAAPCAGSVKNLFVNCYSGPGTGKVATITLMVNGSATALTASLNGAGTSGSDTTHSVTVARGDLLALRYTSDAVEYVVPLCVSLCFATTVTPTVVLAVAGAEPDDAVVFDSDYVQFDGDYVTFT